MLYESSMSLNYYKAETERVCKSKGWDRAPIDTVWLLLSEEVGELASAIRQYKKMYKKTNLKKERGTDVMMEMGDVFSYLVSAGTYVERRSRSDVGRTPIQDELTKNII
jgi:NTP pyrophosphatase (non-canonical NTP hydrolase)